MTKPNLHDIGETLKACTVVPVLTRLRFCNGEWLTRDGAVIWFDKYSGMYEAYYRVRFEKGDVLNEG